MAFDWDHVEKIRAEQEASRMRYDSNIVPNDEVASRVNQSAGARETNSPHLDRYEALIMKMRTQLIDYIVAHGLVDGWILDGVLQPIQNGKIVLTSDTIKQITDKFGYFTEEITKEYLDKYLPENHYVSDENYVHTDNNYNDEAVAKLDGIEAGAEVNNIIDIVFNGSTVLDGDTRVATITITAEDIKEWYESNPDVNPFTDTDKAKLDGIETGAQVNAVEDVTIDGATVLDPADKTAKITKEIIKTSYESNEDTNAFTDDEKVKLAGIADGAEVNDVKDVTLDGESVVDKNKIAKFTAAAIKTSYESNANTNAFTDADKELVEKTVPVLSEQNHDHEKRLGELELSQHLQDDDITKLKEKDTALEKEIADAKDSISELGDEVNSVAGRVTTLESSQTTQDDALTAHNLRISALEKTTTETIPAEITEINKKDAEQDQKLSELTEAVENAGKVNDVQVDGKSVLDPETKTANITGVAKTSDIPDVSDLVPYTGATSNIELGGKRFITTETGDFSEMTPYALATHRSNGVETNVFPGEIRTDETTEQLIFAKEPFNEEKGSYPLQKIAIDDPTEEYHAATKNYVDEKVASIPSADTSNLVPYTGATKNLVMGNHNINLADDTGTNTASIRPTNIFLANSNDYSVSVGPTGINTGSRNAELRITKSGAGLQKVALDTPSEDYHATTKSYVDNEISSYTQLNYVPYDGARYNVLLTDHSLACQGSNGDEGAIIDVGYVAVNNSNGSLTMTPDGFTAPNLVYGISFYKDQTEGTYQNLNIADPVSDEHAATKKYVDDKISATSGKEIKTVLLSQTFTNDPPSTTWGGFDFASGDFMGIPFGDLLSYNAWAQNGSDQKHTNINYNIEVRTAALTASNGNFAGIRIARKNTGSSAETYTVFVLITYRK